MDNSNVQSRSRRPAPSPSTRPPRPSRPWSSQESNADSHASGSTFYYRARRRRRHVHRHATTKRRHVAREVTSRSPASPVASLGRPVNDTTSAYAQVYTWPATDGHRNRREETSPPRTTPPTSRRRHVHDYAGLGGAGHRRLDREQRGGERRRHAELLTATAPSRSARRRPTDYTARSPGSRPRH
jgi:hypothetical protein